ncbi:MAG: hypothetical protein WA688_04755 [Thermoplasmata archaeon]
MNAQLKSPDPSVVIVVPLKVPSEQPVGGMSPPLKETVAPDDRLYPEPVTVYVAPTGPCPGVTVIAGAVTVTVKVPPLAPHVVETGLLSESPE